MSPTWEAVKGTLQEEDLKIAIDLPEGWHRFRDKSDDIILTKYGLALQNIRLSKQALADLNNEAKKPLSASALPHEVANWVGEQFMAGNQLMNQRILGTDVALVAGHPGYQLQVSFKNAEGLRYRVLQYGYLYEETLVRLTYEAVAQDYYDRDLSNFEQVRASYREMAPLKEKEAGKS